MQDIFRDQNHFTAPIRLCQLIFACIVAGVVGALLQVFESIGVRGQGPFILVESVAGLSILLVFIFAAAGLNNVGIWPVSVIMAILWITSFVNLINAIDPVHCSGLRVLEQRSHIDICGQYKVAVGFIFASFLAWIFGLIEVFRLVNRTWQATVANAQNLHPLRKGAKDRDLHKKSLRQQSFGHMSKAKVPVKFGALVAILSEA
ncbi:MAG: hypothetical protein Q9190_003390 [Brigantiaea leucoxantha]